MESKPLLHSYSERVNTTVIMLLLVSSLTVFAGRAYQHLYYDIPIRILIWDQHLMEGFVLHTFGVRWDEFIRSPEWDYRIQFLVRLFGVFYLICFFACVALIFKRLKRLKSMMLLLPPAAVFLFLLTILYYLDRFSRVGELLEFSCQWFAPVALFLVLRNGVTGSVIRGLRLSIALTFIGHGLYAVGIYPVPGHFIDMIIIGLGVSQEMAMRVLSIAGWLDFAVAGLIFVPRAEKYAALYAAIWGALTAFARIWTNFDLAFPEQSLSQWVYETLVRVPNALLPLAVFFIARHLYEERYRQKVLLK